MNESGYAFLGHGLTAKWLKRSKICRQVVWISVLTIGLIQEHVLDLSSASNYVSLNKPGVAPVFMSINPKPFLFVRLKI